MSNAKYGRLITDEQFIQRVIQDIQYIIDKRKEELGWVEYSEDCMKDEILDELDELQIYPNDIDYIMNNLNF